MAQRIQVVNLSDFKIDPNKNYSIQFKDLEDTWVSHSTGFWAYCLSTAIRDYQNHFGSIYGQIKITSLQEMNTL